jgi:hypothetical protein
MAGTDRFGCGFGPMGPGASFFLTSDAFGGTGSTGDTGGELSGSGATILE